MQMKMQLVQSLCRVTFLILSFCTQEDEIRGILYLRKMCNNEKSELGKVLL